MSDGSRICVDLESPAYLGLGNTYIMILPLYMSEV